MQATPEQLDTSLADLQQWGLDDPTMAALDRAGFLWVRNFIGLTTEQLRTVDNIDGKRIEQIQRVLAAFLRGDQPLRSAASLTYRPCSGKPPSSQKA